MWGNLGTQPINFRHLAFFHLEVQDFQLVLRIHGLTISRGQASTFGASSYHHNHIIKHKTHNNITLYFHII